MATTMERITALESAVTTLTERVDRLDPPPAPGPPPGTPMPQTEKPPKAMAVGRFPEPVSALVTPPAPGS